MGTLCLRVGILSMQCLLLLSAGVLTFSLGVLGQSIEEDLVPMKTKWKKFCLDNFGNKYKKNQKVTGTCMQYTCTFRKRKYSWKSKDLKTCCKVSGLMYPMYN